MKIVIKNFKYLDGFNIDTHRLYTILIKRINFIGLTIDSATYNNESITLTSKGYVFKSKNSNHIYLKEGDKRIEKLGRKYLETYRITEVQFKNLNKLLKNVFSNLFISCDIYLYEFNDDDNSFLIIKSQDNKYNELPKPKSFSMERSL